MIENNVAEFDVSASMESKINDLDAKTYSSCTECPDDV